MNYFGEIPASVIHAKIGTMPDRYLKLKRRSLPTPGQTFKAREWPRRPGPRGDRWRQYRVIAVQQNGLYLVNDFFS
jgi:hypothetical protein